MIAIIVYVSSMSVMRGWSCSIWKLQRCPRRTQNYFRRLWRVNDVSHVTQAMAELQNIQKYKCPRDILICLMNCCKIVNAAIGKEGGSQGADDFIPYMVYVLIHAAPTSVLAVLEFVQSYRDPSQLTPEVSYYLTSILAVATFVENLSARDLAISNEDYTRYPPIAFPT